jgi:quinoprotein glucose dehydrogenase
MLLDKDGLPGSNPPWGEMTAIDLNSGHIKWKIPFGEVKDPSSKNIIFGDVNFGGAIITKPGLIFANGTRDGYARAFNIQNGEELWKASLPAPGSAPPMTYNFEGCQYVVFTATGGQFYGYRRSDAIVAYKLKNCSPK